MSDRFHDVDRRGQTWEWTPTALHGQSPPTSKLFLVLGPRTPTTHRILDLETGETTHVRETVLSTFTATWRRVA